MERQYDIHDLVTAQVNATRFAGKHPDLADFHSARYRALSLAFGFEDTAESGDRALETLAEAGIQASLGLHSPFSGFLEAPTSVIEFYHRYGPAIDDGIQQTAAAIRKLLEAVVSKLHGIPADRTVNDDDLRRNGFDPSTPWPEEFDYW
jgi:hypothetical protein